LTNEQHATHNITSLEIGRVYGALLKRSLQLLLAPENREKRRQNFLTAGDAIFNLIKISFLHNTILKYRYMVQFKDLVVLDSTFPPFPSKAFDKRISNYINHFDMQEIPSGIVSISTTNCCPYACSFCSTSAHRNPDLDLDENLVKLTIKQVESLGVPTIILHGGEPLFRYERFLRLVKHVHDETCLWMFTTGCGSSLDRACELRENGLFGVWISLDHFDPDAHNKLRGHPKAFDNACRAVEHFKKAGVYTCLSLVPPDDLLEPAKFIRYYDFAKDLGVAEIRILERKPCGRERESGVVPHSKTLEKLQQDLFHDQRYKDHPPISGLSTWLEKDEALGCQCRFEYLFITSRGDVQPCEASEIAFGNITQEDFYSIYERICSAFPKPVTGCIPMVMFPEIQKYQKTKNGMGSKETAQLSCQIMHEFQNRGFVPGAYRPLWPIYERRLRTYRNRKDKARVPN